MELQTVEISTIEIGERHRKQMGDTKGLAQSIKEIGLLQPIGITPERRLLYGRRRLRVCDQLGWKEIPALIIDIKAIVLAEHAENEFRKALTLSERVTIAAEVKAALAERRGNPSIRHTRDELKGRTDEFLATSAGFSSRGSYQRAKTVVEKGTAELVQAMDEGTIPLSTAAALAHAPPEKQKRELSAPQIRKAAAAERRKRSKKTRRARVREEHATPPDPPFELRGAGWKVTSAQEAVPCELVLVRLPFCEPEEPWTSAEVRASAEEACNRWTVCGADHFAVFWTPELVSEGQAWLDEWLCGYQYHQVLISQARTTAYCGSSVVFGRCWQPIFVYRRAGMARHARSSATTLDLHLHTCQAGGGRAPPGAGPLGPESESTEADQNLTSVMGWLIDNLTRRRQKVASLLCGRCACGAAAVRLGRAFHGVDTDRQRIAKAAERLTRVAETVKAKPR
ncbi:MAG: ParB/RepB/Spo0J family partition protein [Pirellulales bacterium]